MKPVHELLNRIHWDLKFGKGSFELGFLDRVEDKIIRIHLSKVFFVHGNTFSFIIRARKALNMMCRFIELRPFIRTVN